MLMTFRGNIVPLGLLLNLKHSHHRMMKETRNHPIQVCKIRKT